MKTNNGHGAQNGQQIASQEAELKALLTRVMEAPLDPLVQRVAQMEQRLQTMEEILRETRDAGTAISPAIIEQGKKHRIKINELNELIEERHKTIGNMLGVIQADALTNQEKLGNLIIVLNEELRVAGSRIEEAATAQVRAADNLKAHIERIFNTFQTQLENSRKDEVVQLKHGFQSRLWWVVGICCLSLLTNIFMVIR
jgi:hypothetical protein